MTTFEDIAQRLETLAIEVPSWAYGNSGTRFKVFGAPGTARSVEEKIDDAATVHRFTGLAPRVALHIPWDAVDDYSVLRKHAEDRGVALGTINSNTFQDDDYKLGSLTHADPRVRRKAVQHNLDCIEVMQVTGSRDLKIWLADGTNYPGQGDIRAARTGWPRVCTPSTRSWARISGWSWSTSSSNRPSTTPTSRTGARRTSTSLRWGTAPRSAWTPVTTRPVPTSSSSWPSCCGSGSSARSTSTAASTLTTTSSSAAPTRSSCSGSWSSWLRAAGSHRTAPWALMLDQCHNIERKIPGQLRSVLNVQEMTARALLVDDTALAQARRDGDVLAANEILMDAFYTDVRKDLAAWRERHGLARDPMQAYLASGYQERIEAERVGGTQAGWA
jgi:L-rhamnose isomerase/sugar isomerase